MIRPKGRSSLFPTPLSRHTAYSLYKTPASSYTYHTDEKHVSVTVGRLVGSVVTGQKRENNKAWYTTVVIRPSTVAVVHRDFMVLWDPSVLLLYYRLRSVPEHGGKVALTENNKQIIKNLVSRGGKRNTKKLLSF